MPSRWGRLAHSAAIIGLMTSGLAESRGAETDKAAGDEAALPQSYLSANGLLNRGHYDLAAAEYRTFLDEHPGHDKAPTAQYGLAVCLYRTEALAEAESLLGLLWDIDRFPYAAEVAAMLGQVRLANGDYAGAADSFRRVVERFGDHALADDATAGIIEAFYLDGGHDRVEAASREFLERWADSPLAGRVRFFLAGSLMSRGQYSQAADEYGALLDRAPDGPFAEQAAFFRAQCLHRSDALERAERAYRRVLESPDGAFTPDALFGLGSVLHVRGRLDESGAVLDRLLVGYAGHELRVPAAMQRARVWFDQKEYELAFALFEEIARSGAGERDAAEYWAAKCCLRQGNYSEAGQRLGHALKEFPESSYRAEMMYDRAVALVEADEPKAAAGVLTTFRSEFEDNPLAADALHLLAVLAHRLGDYEQSQALCREFTQKYPRHDSIATVEFVSAENDFFGGRHEAAVEEYQAFIERFPDDPRSSTARERLGIALYRLGRFEEAEPHLIAAPAGAAGSQSAHLALGDIYFQRGEWKKSQEHLQRYLSGDSDRSNDGGALLQLGLARQRQGQHAAALDAYERVLKTPVDEAVRRQALFERGQVLMVLDRVDEAAAAFEALLRDAPDSRFAAYAENHLAGIALRRGDYAGAEKRFARVVDSPPSPEIQAEAMFQRGQALMALMRYAEAENVFSELLKKHPSGKSAERAGAQLAVALSRQDKHDRAIAVISGLEENTSVRLDESLRATLRYEKAWSLRAAGRIEEAAAVYRDLLAQEQAGDVRVHAALELAEIEFESGRYEEAASLLRPLADSLPSASSYPAAALREPAMYRLGVCEFELARHREAAGVLEAFIRNHPESGLRASAGYYCGEALFRDGRHERAADHFDRVVKETPDSPSCGPSLLRLGECYAALQRWARSEQAFTDYLERFGGDDYAYQARFGLGWARENQGRHDEAMAAYRQVVAEHRGPTAARAQFQIGECLYARQKYDEAVRAYLKVDILYACPEWSAAALYEAGRCFEKMARPVEARAQFRRVAEQYGQTRWAAPAAERLAEIAAGPVPGR